MEYLAVFLILLFTQGIQTFVLWYLLTPMPTVVPAMSSQPTPKTGPIEIQVKPQRERSGLSITHVPCIVASTEERFSVRLQHGKPPETCRTKDGVGVLAYAGSKDTNGAYIYELKTE